MFDSFAVIAIATIIFLEASFEPVKFTLILRKINDILEDKTKRIECLRPLLIGDLSDNIGYTHLLLGKLTEKK